MKRDYINAIKEIFKEYDQSSFGFFYGRSFTITYDSITYDVLEVGYDDEEDYVFVTSVSHNSFGLSELNIENLSTKTIKKILDKINNSIEEDYE